MVVNLSMHSDGELSINHYLCDTIASVFPYIRTADVPYTTNRELFAMVKQDPAARLEQGMAGLADPSLRAMMETVSAALKPYAAEDHILTDDRAPVEVLGMRMIDSLIQEELGYYQNIFENEGLQGLLKSLGI